MAYEFTKLVDSLKEDGLEIAEDAAKKVVERVMDWVAESAQESENSMDDVLVALMPMIKPTVLSYVDKIHDESGESPEVVAQDQ